MAKPSCTSTTNWCEAVTRKFTRVTDSYEAVDSKGRVELVHVHTEFVEEVYWDGPVELETGKVEHRLAGGAAVAVSEDGALRVVSTGKRLRRLQ